MSVLLVVMSASGAPERQLFSAVSLFSQRDELPTYAIDLPAMVTLPPMVLTVVAMIVVWRRRHSVFVKVCVVAQRRQGFV